MNKLNQIRVLAGIAPVKEVYPPEPDFEEELLESTLTEDEKKTALGKIEFVFTAGPETQAYMKKLLKFLKKAKFVGDAGTGLTVTYEDNAGKKDQFYLDGDGSFKVHEIKQKIFKKDEKEEGKEEKKEETKPEEKKEEKK